MRELEIEIQEATKRCNLSKKRKPRLPNVEKLSLIECITQIVDLARDSKLQVGFFKKSLPYVQKVAGILQITNMQAVVFSLFMNEFHSSSIQLSEIANFIDSTPLHLLKYSEDIEVLEKHKLLRARKNHDVEIEYLIPKSVVEAIKKNKPFEPQSYKNISIQELMNILNDFFENTCREFERESFIEDFTEIIDILYQNENMPFVKKLKDYSLRKDQVFILLFFCHCFINNDDEEIRIRDFKSYFERKTFFVVKREFESKEGNLFEKELIQNCIDNGFCDQDTFCLTNKAKQEFLMEFNITINVKQQKRKDIISYDSIVQKILFYNPNEEEQINTLSKLLQQEKFEQITHTLAGKGMRKGFAILFYGSPGTGKTETAMQIARQTQRDIFWVDISQTKSMWFGQSEKEIKAIFDNYKKMVQKHTPAPILLFNEADAVINTRQSLGNAKSVDKTENAIQNIILQEMENLEGIMVATTNLTENLDKAFERRFLYKINFQKPAIEIKQKIWKSMIVNLEENEILSLAKAYDFSGGQIENIARKKTVQEAIEGKNISFERLQFFCNEENINNKKNHQIIGFNRQ